jgi:hypothetical protein
MINKKSEEIDFFPGSYLFIFNVLKSYINLILLKIKR